MTGKLTRRVMIETIVSQAEKAGVVIGPDELKHIGQIVDFYCSLTPAQQFAATRSIISGMESRGINMNDAIQSLVSSDPERAKRLAQAIETEVSQSNPFA